MALMMTQTFANNPNPSMTDISFNQAQENSRKKRMIARMIFWIMLSIVILSELMFAILVDVLGNSDILGSLLKTVGIITFSILLYKGFKWEKWILGIFCFLYALAMILAGIDNSVAFKNGINVFYVLCGVFFLYGILIFVLPKYLIRN